MQFGDFNAASTSTLPRWRGYLTRGGVGLESHGGNEVVRSRAEPLHFHRWDSSPQKLETQANFQISWLTPADVGPTAGVLIFLGPTFIFATSSGHFEVAF
jgi:hypothetical protein